MLSYGRPTSARVRDFTQHRRVQPSRRNWKRQLPQSVSKAPRPESHCCAGIASQLPAENVLEGRLR